MRKVIGPRLLAAAVALAAAVLVGVGGATATTANPAPSSTPQHDSQIQNLGLVKNQIKAYYGDKGDHKPSPNSPYARDLKRVQDQLKLWLKVDQQRHSTGRPAVVFDVDDTVLSNYTYDVTHDFGYDPVTNAQCVQTRCFPAVFGMVDVVKWAASHQLAVFFVTGRPGTQQDATLANLREQGFPAPAGLFTKPTAAPWPPYLTCAPSCSTVQYKSGTRAHIEALGYHIIANTGDQYSDLQGGHADRTFKIPNPMYYLP